MKTPFLSALRQALQLARAQAHQPYLSAEEIMATAAARRVDRRRFLRTGAQAGLLLGLGGSAMANNLTRAVLAGEKIAIVGAGLAGLTAASYLKASGVAAVLYEGDKRPAGRIKSARVFDNGKLNTEFGAEFIDTSHKDMFNLIRSLGLQHDFLDMEMDTFGTKDAFFIDGRHYSMQQVAAELNPVYKQIRKDQKRMEKCEGLDEFDRLSIAEYTDRLPVSSWLKKMINAAYVGENGMEAEEQSAINMLSTITPEKNHFIPFGESDERFKVIGGNEQVPRKLAEQLGDQIRYEHKLVALKEKNNGSITLTFNNGGTTVEETFDVVIMAVPFSVLREVQIDMKLPEIKRKVIRELSYGTNTKFILETSERTWRKNGYRGYLFNEHIHNGWDSSQMQQNNTGAGTFTVYYGGKNGKTATKGTESQQLASCVPILDAAFPGTRASLTGKQELVYWPGNPFVKGSYSCFSVGQAAQFAGQAYLPVRNLYFAGEHCSEDYWGFMNGAAQTGRLSAQALLRKMGKLK